MAISIVRASLAAVTYQILHLLCYIYQRLLELSRELRESFPFPRKVEVEQYMSYSFGKIPRKVGLILTEDTKSTPGVARAILSCTAFGVSELDLYWGDGACEYDLEEIAAEMQRQGAIASISKGGAILTSLVARVLKLWCLSSVLPTVHNATLRPTKFLFGPQMFGAGSGKRLTNVVRLMGGDSGRGAITRVATWLCERISQGHGAARDVDQGRVDELLRDGAARTDPELAIIFGPARVLAGYLPWHMRLTEIQCVRTLLYWLDSDSVGVDVLRDWHRIS
jgi:hypothetical protein